MRRALSVVVLSPHTAPINPRVVGSRLCCMEPANWISLAALLVAILSWLDSRRRIRASELRFQIERGSATDETWFCVRNIGTRKLESFKFDAEHLSYYAFSKTAKSSIAPGEAAAFWLTSNRGSFPDSIVLLTGRAWNRRIVVPFHPLPFHAAPKSTEQ